MWFHSFLASWKTGLSRSRRPQPRPPRRGTRLVLEHLEDRTLPSAYTAASVSALIADISAANTAGGANTITLSAPTTSPYALTARNNGGALNIAANGLPVIAANDNLTIVGNGDTIEDTAGEAVPFRLLDVAPLASLTLQNLTLQGGCADYGGLAGDRSGGAIYNQGALTLSGVTVANNQANQGYNCAAGVAGYGGGVWSNGSLTLENGTLFQGNVAYGGPGVFLGNVANVPGGPGFGGAVYVAGGAANITNTTFTGNSAIGGQQGSYVGSIIGEGCGGALYVAAGQVILTNAAVNNNNAGCSASFGNGGGLYVAGGTVTLANDTVESNSASYFGGNGGGLYVAGGTVNFTNDTVQSNVSTYGGGVGGSGGGLFIASGATVYLDSFTVANTINNTDSTGINGSTANIDGSYIETPAAGQPPIVVHAASANPSPVTGTTTSLTVLGADAAGASSLTYTWAATSAPAGAPTPTFSSNGTNASQNTTATFYRAGTYTFQVTLTDPSGLTTVSSVTVTVAQTVTSLSVTPGNVTVADGAKQQFTAVALDQFGQTMASQPTCTWQVSSSSGGTISSTGLYTAPKKGTGKFQVEVSADGLTALANVTLDA